MDLFGAAFFLLAAFHWCYLIASMGRAIATFKTRFGDSESGQGLAEYIIIVILVAIVIIFALRSYGGSLFGQFKNATQEINTAQSTQEKVRPEGQSKSGSEQGNQGSGGTNPDSGSSSAEANAQKSKGNNGSSETLPSTNIDGRVAELRGGVGDDSSKPVEDIRISLSTLLTLAAVVVGVGVLLFMVTMRKKDKKKGKKGKKKAFSLGKEESGQAMVEFVLSAITFFFVILGVIQLAMVLNAYSLVRYAAYNAARAAIVHGGDQGKMEEAARMSLLATFPSHGRADTPRGVYENYMGAKLTDGLPYFPLLETKITKVELVRRPGADGVVTFDDPKDTPKAIVTVKVTHLYELVIPLVNRIVFRVYQMGRFGLGYDGSTVDKLAAETDQSRRTGAFRDTEFRIPLVGVYTMRMQSDLS